MRLIPGKTKVQIELFKGISLWDMLVAGIGILLVLFVLISSLPGKFYIITAIIIVFVALLVRMDTVPNYRYLLQILKHFAYNRSYSKSLGTVSKVMPYTAIKDGYIEYDGKYYGAVLEIPPVEFRFFSQIRRDNSIVNGLGRVLRNLHGEFSANIVKIERPIIYDNYLNKEYERLSALKESFRNGVLSEEEMKARVEILYDRIEELQKLCDTEKVVAPFYYLVLFESDKRQLDMQVSTAIDALAGGEIECKRLNDKELAVFLRYTDAIDFDEHEINDIEPEKYANWAMPETLKFNPRTVEINNIMTHNLRIVNYPSIVEDAWLATVMSMPATKVVVKCRPMEHAKAVKNLDRSLQELRGQLMTTGVDSKVIELQNHIESLSELLSTLQGESESLLETNIYITAYDIALTRSNPTVTQPPESILSNITGMKKMVRRLYQEHGFRVNNMEFGQMQAFIGSQISAYDPLANDGRGIPSNSLAASYPWVFANVSDEGGMKLGSSDGIPVFLDFFKRDNERINSNMVIIGKSGSGKSYATKDILTNLAADDCKIFILDPENEYTELAGNLHGKFINVGNATQGRINPFQIITALDDDGNGENKVTGSYATHLQFLEEFFRQILPDCDKDAMEYLNSLIDRMYTNFGITDETDLSKLSPSDYPIFDDLYDAVLQEFQQTDNEYIRSILRILMNYVAKFSTGGRNANIWNGPSSITTDENFIVFNFQSLLANRNSTIANAQMLLVLKYVDNEIIKNRDYNLRYHTKRKIVVAIDEAHVFIDTKFPVALDFMFQLAKRIRKYNGMQIVITQNIKDFVGSEEIARKSTAIINACQYSFIFALAPNDMSDLCTLYEKAGGINEQEQEQITTAQRGQAFSILGSSSRTSFRVEVPEDVVDMFENPDFVSNYFTGEKGSEYWEDFVGDSREIAKKNQKIKPVTEEIKDVPTRKHVTFTELTEEEALKEELSTPSKMPKSNVTFEEVKEEDLSSETFIDKEVKTEPHKNIKTEESTPYVRESLGTTNSRESSQTELVLANLLEKFSYDSLSAQIQDAVRQQVAIELAKELKARGIDASQDNDTDLSVKLSDVKFSGNNNEFPEDLNVTKDDSKQIKDIDKKEYEEEYEYDDAETEVEADEDDDGYEIFSDDDEVESSNDTVEALDTTDENFDLMSMLKKLAIDMDDVTPIDVMDSYGEEVVDVSLEDLVKYIQKNIYHQK